LGTIQNKSHARAKVIASPSAPRLLMLLVTAVWIGFIFLIATMPRMPQAPVVPDRLVEPLGHYGAYFVLAMLAYTLIASPRPGLLNRLAALVAAAGASIAVGLGIEVVQHYTPDRASEVGDVIVNAFGAVTGAVAVFTLEQLKVNRRLLAAAIAGVVLAIVVLTTVAAFVWDPNLPRIGDHWHARYTISVCGRTLPPLPETKGGVHTHGYGLIHVHPHRNYEAGDNATLALFMETTGGFLSDSRLKLPTGESYATGDTCAGGKAGEIVVFANGERLTRPSAYVPRDRDIISIEFRPVG
jgi:VanZ family protein